MRLKKISLHRVGQYKDDEIGEFQNGLNILYGPNEAGKSTFLAGLRGMLFGKVILSDEMVATPAGAFGQMWLVNEDGREFHIDRALSKKSPPKVTFEDGIVRSGTSILADVFPELSEVEETLFRSIFTFQLSDLREATKDNGLQKRLYGIHETGQNPIQIETELEEKAKAIFVPRRSAKRQLNQCLQDLDEVMNAMKEAADKPDDYHNTLTELAVCTEHIAQFEDEIDKLTAKRHDLRIACDFMPDLRVWQKNQLKLNAMVHLPQYELSTISRIEWVKSRLQELDEKRKTIDLNLLEMVHQHDCIIINEQLLSAAPFITTLQKDFGTVSEQNRQKSKLEEQIFSIVHERIEIESQLSDFWTEHRLENLDLTTARHEVLQSLNSAFHDALAVVGNEERIRQEKTADEAGARQQVEKYAPSASFEQKIETDKSSIAERRSIFRDEETRLDAYNQIVIQLDQLNSSFAANAQLLEARRQGSTQFQEERLKRILKIGWLGVLFFAFLSIWLLSISNIIPAIATIACGSVLTIGLALFGRAGLHVHPGDGHSEEAGVDNLKARILDVESKLVQIGEGFVFLEPAGQDISAIVQMRKFLSDYRAKTDELAEQLSMMERAFEGWQKAVQQMEKANATVTLAKNKLQSIEDTLRGELAGLLEEDAEKIDVGRFMSGFFQEAAAVRDWRKLKRQESQLALDKSQIQLKVQIFCKSVHDALHPFLQEAHQNDSEREVGVAIEDSANDIELSDIELYLNMVSKKLEVTQEMAREKEKCSIQIRQLKRMRDELTEEIRSLEAEVSGVFTRLGVADWDLYQQTVEQIKLQYALKLEAENLFRQLTARCSGSHAKFEELVLFLEDKTQEDLDSLLSSIEDELKHEREQLHDALNKQGLLQNQVSDFRTSHTSERLNWDRASLESQRDKLAWDWAAYVVARSIARNARTMYEEANQPHALQLTSGILNEITDGRYQAVKSMMDASGGHVLYAVQKDGMAISVANLSRGTKEQLYLAVRLAMVQMFQERNVILPVVLDDPMVNFDWNRATRYFDVLHRAASEHQFIYLTCHHQIVDFAKSYKDVHIVELRRGSD